MKEPNITIECELTMRLRPPDIPAEKSATTLSNHSPRTIRTYDHLHHIKRKSFSPGLITLEMNQVSRFNERQGATGTYTEIATPGANATTYTDNDTALLDGTQYYYKVRATQSRWRFALLK